MIAFSGLDGAGKSTQIDLLAKIYSNNKYKSLVFWSRGGYTPGMKFLKNILKVSKKTSKKENINRQALRKKSFSNSIVRKTWLGLAILDLIFFYVIYIRLKEFFGTKVICDRYIYDTLLDFELNFSQEKVEKWLLWRLLLLLSVKPKKHFVITIPVIESLRRSELKNEPFPDSQEILKSRLDSYEHFVLLEAYVIHIDGSKTIESIQSEILKELNI